MKRIFLALALMLCVTGKVEAMDALTEPNIQHAQAFGISQKGVPSGNLLQKWTIFDSKKSNKYADKERAIIYTPYLVAAVDAQNNAKKGITPTLQHGVALAKEYEGILAIGLIIDSAHKVEPKFLKIQIDQEGNVVEPYSTVLDMASVHDKVMEAADINTQAGGLSESEKAKLAQVKKDVEQKARQTVGSQAAGGQQQAQQTSSPIVKREVTVKVWNLQYFTYFDLSKLSVAKPMNLVVSDQAGGQRLFKINLGVIN